MPTLPTLCIAGKLEEKTCTDAVTNCFAFRGMLFTFLTGGDN